MNKNNESHDCCKQNMFFKNQGCHSHGGSNPIYGLGVIGGLFYFLQGANTFSTIIIGICKAFFWPAIILFKLLTDLKL